MILCELFKIIRNFLLTPSRISNFILQRFSGFLYSLCATLMGAMTTMVSVIFFLCFVGRVLIFNSIFCEDKTSSPILLTALRNTSEAIIRAHVHQCSRSVLWWRMKLVFFHLFMIVTYIFQRSWEWTKREANLLLFGLSYPVLPWIRPLLYLSGISFTLTCTAVVDTVRIISWSCKGFSTDVIPTEDIRVENRRVEMNLFQKRTTIPEKWVALGGVNLAMEFVGFLAKIGILFIAFLDSLHRMGTNTVFWVMLLRASSMQTIQGRVDGTLSACCYPHRAITNGIKRRNNVIKEYEKEIWRLDAEAMTEDNFSWSFQPIWETDDSTPSTTEQLKMPHEDTICLMVDATDIGDILAMANETEGEMGNQTFTFATKPTEFGTDNCATHHISYEKELFIGEIRDIGNVGVKGISGSAIAAGIGTIQFTIKDSKGEQELVTLENVIYLPQASKNLISIAQWSADRGDNCGIFSRGDYSIFFWDNDKKSKHIDHSPTCRIPLMPVNEGEDQFAFLVSSHLKSFSDNEHLGPVDLSNQTHNDDPTLMNKHEGGTSNLKNDKGKTASKGSEVDQQSTKVLSTSPFKPIYPEGSTVRALQKGEKKICVVDKVILTGGGDLRYRIRPLNGTTTVTLAEKDIRHVHPEPGDIPLKPSEVDNQIMTQCLSSEDLEKLWSGNVDSTISDEERITLYWHHRLQCMPLISLHRLAERGVLPRAILTVKKLPLCASCAFATAHRRSWRGKGKKNRPIRHYNCDKPGSGTSCDHIVSHEPGLIPQSTGTLTHKRFWGSVLFVDHMSDFMYNHLITGTSSMETLRSKQAYERVALSYGVQIKTYHADNLRFNDKNFSADLLKGGQTITFCGVGAHHQNAVVESKIKEVCYGGRTILLHAQRKWPTVISTVLWPYAVQAIVERHNRLSLDQDGKSPLEKFSGIDDEITPTDFHTWGCPVYILEAANQSGGIGTPKWEPRSHTGIYLGHSPCHAGSVALVLNISSGLVSPQYHLVFDDKFTTVPYLESSKTPPNWQDLLANSTEQATDEQQRLSFEWLHPQEQLDGAGVGTSVGTNSDVDQDGAVVGDTLGTVQVGTPLGLPDGANTDINRDGDSVGTALGSFNTNYLGASAGTDLGTDSDSGNMDAGVGTALGTKASRGHSPTPGICSSKGAKLKASWNDPLVPKGVPSVPISPGEDITDKSPFVNLDTLGLRRGARKKNATNKLKESRQTDPHNKLLSFHKPHALMILALTAFTTPIIDAVHTGKQAGATAMDIGAKCYQARAVEYKDFLETNFDGTSNNTSPFAQIYMTSQANNETYTLKEMLQQPDRDDFMEAMRKEVDSLFKEEIWAIVPRQQMKDHYATQRKLGKDIKREQIMMIWSFKRKRHPDGTLDKHKARLCCHGGQQQWGVNYWDTYAPVVSWSSIRILMTLSKLHNLHTKSVDFVQAYPQAEIKSSIYLQNPAGVVLTNKGDVVLKLLKNLYGLKDAGLTWFEHLSAGLEDIGFAPTASDPCIFVKGTDMIILYVDDCIIISKTKEEADRVFSELDKRGYKMTDEGNMEEYLGILITHGKDKSFRMSQPFLIDRIIASIPGMTDARSASTPAVAGEILNKDIGGELRKEHWNYRSVIGMLNYLVNCTHPEMSFAVHQCARFCNDPKHSHEQAVKRIIRYLLSTKRGDHKDTGVNQGLIYHPDKSKSIDTYVDASFAGEWNTTWSEEPASVMSRTGYIILYANCPIIWCSKLQTEITLSTTESEYVALSQSMRDVIPLLDLLKELGEAIPSEDATPNIHCTIFEDNKGCIDLVTAPKMRPRTKHIALKYHHFRSYVKKRLISINYVETTRQIADIFTKPLNDTQFRKLRYMLNGW